MNTEQQEKKIKGTMVIDVVKTIKGVKDAPWDEHLSEDAKRLLSEKILPSVWYPHKPVLECIWAVYKLLGNSDPNAARQWGKANGRKLFESVYRNLGSENDTGSALQKLELISNKAFSKGFESRSQRAGDRHYRVIFKDDDPASEVICYLVTGWIEAIIEMTGGSNGRVNVQDRHWNGSDSTVIDVQWD